jgi:hypothetical protein
VSVFSLHSAEAQTWACHASCADGLVNFLWWSCTSQGDLAGVKKRVEKAEATEREADKAGMDPLALSQLATDLHRDKTQMTSDQVSIKVGACSCARATASVYLPAVIKQRTE